MTSLERITPAQLKAALDSGPIELVDVRTPAEFEELHAVPARNVPLDQFDPRQFLAARTRADAPLYVICRSGQRAARACKQLVACGCENAVVVEGGTLAWEQAGLPVVRGKKTMSLERQVRIAAGSIVLIGVVLTLAVSPYFALLSGFIGAGLVFSGLTDTCGMGMLLARMPWNRVGGSDSCSAGRA
jgi:rhodanese-related sulfurtransferase